MELFDIALRASDAEFQAQVLTWLALRIGFDGVVWGGGKPASEGGLSITRSVLVGRPNGLLVDYPSCTAFDPVSAQFLTLPEKLQNVSTHRLYQPLQFAPIRDYLDHYRVRQLQLAGMRHWLTREYSWMVFYREEETRPFPIESETSTRNAVQLVLLAEYLHRSVHEHVEIVKPEGSFSNDVKQLDQLTHRQRSVLQYLEKGWPNKLIAHHLAISENTLKNHLKAVFRVLGVQSRTQAIIASRKLREQSMKG